MKKGTTVGLLLVAVSIILTVWVLVGGNSSANQTIDGSYVVDDSGQLIEYIGSGGNITLPAEVTSIAANVFKNNTSITRVNLTGVTHLGSDVFAGCSELQAVDLGTGLTSIPANTFFECNSLSSVSIPATVTSIGSNAFYGTALQTVTIPASVTTIALDAFRNCRNLRMIAVNAGNAFYESVDGCLYNKAKTTLLIVPEGKTSISIPSGVTEIKDNAFYDSSVNTVTIPASVTNIGSQSGWTPSAIYGEADSSAESFAMLSGITFIVLGEEDPVIPSDPGNPDTPDNPNPGDSDNSNPGNSENPNSGDPTNPDTPSDSNNPGTSGDGGSNGDNVDNSGMDIGATTDNPNGTAVTNGMGTGQGEHTLDSTPTTADGIDPRYFLCFAIFAGGVGVILYSRFNKLQYMSDNRRHS